MANIRLGNLLWKDNTQPNSVSNPVNTKDVNSDDVKGELVAVRNELQLVKDELEAVKGILTDGSQKVQQSGIEGKLEQVRALLQNVSDKDFAKDETLEQARTLLDAISTKDFATQTTLAAVLAKLGQLETEIQAVKANQLSGDQKVQLSGTKTTETSPHNRLIRPHNRIGDLVDVPDGARGAYVYLIIHGVTGTFAEGEGAQLRVYLMPPAPSSSDAIASISTAVSAQRRGHLVVIDKGSSLGEIVPWDEGRVTVSGLGLCPGSRMRFDVVISGTFADGEGIDCEVLVKWIYS